MARNKQQGRRVESKGKARATARRSLRFESLEPRQMLNGGPLVISEFLAKANTSNPNALVDDYGSKSDWIEIYNPTATAIDLVGYSLTDSKGDPLQCRFTADSFPTGQPTTIGPGEYKIVFASGRSNSGSVIYGPGGQLHTNFKLSDDPPEYLGLIQPDGSTVAAEFAPKYPVQAADISYGWTTDGTRQGFFFEPSPGLPNGNEVSASSAPIIISEIMYNTARGAPGGIGYLPENIREEYVELYNRGATTTSLAGWQIDNWWFALEPLKRVTGGLTRNGLIATAVVGAGHGYAEGDSVMITGADQAEYNGVFTITAVTATSFDYLITGTPAATATGAITVQKGPRLVNGIARDEWVATVTMTNHGFVNGDTILISGANEEPYNGVFTIADVTAHTFTYRLENLPAAAASGAIVAQKASRNLPNVSLAGQDYLAIAADVKSFREKYPLVTNVVAGWTSKLANNGEQITLRDAAGETVDRVNYSNEGDWGIRTRGEQLVANLTRSGTSVTITVPYHGYTLADRAEDKVYRIAGANQAEFNGEWTLAAVTRDTMTFTIPGTSTSATGTITVQKKDAGHYGWQWYSAADGGGKSLELINAAMSNNNGQNWAASTIAGGTPGAANSVAAADIAPLISDVTHFPIIPRSTDPVYVTAKIVDELATGIQAWVYYRVDGAATFTALAMADDGLHGDGAARDGKYGAILPVQADHTVVEFYVLARDKNGGPGTLTRTWPAAAGFGNGQTANLLYQVDDTYDPTAAWTPGSQPVYRLIMREVERAELALIGSVDPDRWSDAAMNGTFITVDGSGVELIYQAAFRNRGHGTRIGNNGANNYKIEIPHDNPWKGQTETIVNYQNTPSQALGMAIFEAAGLPGPEQQPLQVRVNGVNWALTTSRMYGAYVSKEQYNSDFTSRAYPDDPDGNLYVVHYTDYPYTTNSGAGGELEYRGTNPDAYRMNYFKQTNVAQDDWSDLINLTRVLDAANPAGISDSDFLAEVSKVIDVDQWFRYIAVDTILGNREGGLYSGQGDDYGLYRGMNDTRFILVPWDTDTLMVYNGSAENPYTRSIVAGYQDVAGLTRLFTNPDTLGRYYAQVKQLCETVFAAANFNPLVEQVLGGRVDASDPEWTPQSQRDAIKSWMANRVANVLSQLPQVDFTITSPLAVQGGYPTTTSNSTSLNGTADPIETRSVLVNGQPAALNTATGAWSIGTTTGGSGVSDYLITAGSEWKYYAARGFDVTGYQATIAVADIATAESVISNPANRSGTWTLDTQTTRPATINLRNSGTSGGASYTFQEGVNGYAGTLDTHIRKSAPNTSYENATLNIDGELTTGQADPAHGLLWFNNIFGTAAGQIKSTDVIQSATLTLNITNSSANSMSLYRLLGSWAETITWNSAFGANGIQNNGVEAALTADASLQPGSTGKYTIDVTASLRAWQANPGTNFGWALLPNGTDGIQFSASEDATVANRPLLTVTLASETGAERFTSNNSQFPGQTAAVDNFVVEAKYRVYIPTAGAWTFGVNSDDGFKLELTNGIDPPRVMSYDGPRTQADTLATFTFAQPGTYDLRLIYFENTGDAAVELFAAPGTWTAFGQTNAWRLVGDVAHGGLGDSDQGTAWREATFDDSGWASGPAELGYGDAPGRPEITTTTYVDTDPTTSTVEKNFTTYFRRTFEVTDPAQYTGLIVHMLYDDGAVVYLNGTELFRTANMPTGTITSTTQSGTTPSETTYYAFPVGAGNLRAGTNVLAVEIHQDGATSSDISFDLRLEATRPAGTGTGLPLTPGLNRFKVETFDGPNGSGNKLEEGYIDVWCNPAAPIDTPPQPSGDPAGLEADPHLNIVARNSYVSGAPITVRVDVVDALDRVDRDVWDGMVTLASSNPNVTLSASQITLYNGIGSVLLVPMWNGMGSGDFTLTAAWTDAARGLTRTVQKDMICLDGTPQTIVSGALAGDTTWSGVIHVTGDVTVPVGATLTIQAGTLVLIDGVTSGTAGFDIDVLGSVQSLGTVFAPVTFTTPTYGDTLGWGEIHHANAAASLYQYTEVLRTGRAPGQGHTGAGPAFNVSGSTIVFDHSSISDSIGKIMQSGSGSNLTFRDSLLARAVMGPEIASTSLLFENSFIQTMHNGDDADGIYLHDQQPGQTIVLRGGGVADTFDDGIDTLSSTVLIENMVVRSTNDKGLSVFNGDVTVRNSLFAENGLVAEDGTSVAISGKSNSNTTTTIYLDGVTVYSDTIAIQARRKTVTSGDVITYHVKNSILVAPQPLDISSAVAGLPTGNFFIDYTDTFGNTAGYTIVGGNNINADPLFLSTADHDYRLAAGSPAINAGDPAGRPDTDGSRADLGARPSGANGVYAPQTITGGHITVNTLLYPEAGPYRITGDVIVDPGVTLTILPGATVFFDAGAGLTVNGRLAAEGTADKLIRLTAYPGAGYWDGIHFQNTMEDNRITYAIVEYGEGVYGAGGDNALIGVTNSRLLLDHDTFDHARYRRIRTVNSSLTVTNSTFTDLFGPGEAPLTNNRSEQIWGSNAPNGGWILIQNNVFGTTKGHNDIIDLNGGHRAAGAPVPRILDNVFLGGGDEALDLEGDFVIEGNTFMHFHKDPLYHTTEPGEANVISAGDAANVGYDYLIARNVFYDIDHAVLVKDGSTLNFLNNTVVNVTAGKAAIYFDVVGDSAGAGRAAHLDGNIFDDVPLPIDLTVRSGAPTPTLTVNRSVIASAWHGYGTGNTAENPRLVDPAGGDFRLRPGSPALGAGPNGLNMGAKVAGGASLAGEPEAITRLTSATLTVGGPGITHYKYFVNTIGDWAAAPEYPVAVPVSLTGLPDGTYVVYVVGKNLMGQWQTTPTASQTWTVAAARQHVRINEVLARNTAAVAVGTTYPDMIELFNDGGVAVDLSGMSITDDPNEPAKFVFAAGTVLAPGAFLVLYADNKDGPGIHLGFGLDGDGDGVYLFGAEPAPLAPRSLVDSVVFGPQIVDLSIGRVGHNAAWALTQPTFGAANIAQRTGDPTAVMLNEWFASGNVRLVDDFIELYNPDPLPVLLAGLSLTDNALSQPGEHTIGALSFAAGGGFAAFKADGNTDKGFNHLGFRLDARQEWLGLFDADLKLLDRVLYFDQTADYSQGRSPDGAGQPYQFFGLPTPGAANAALPAHTALLDGLRITEIMYNPAGDNDWEYIELKNIGATTLDLTGVRLGGGVSFTFGAMQLAPNQYVVVARDVAKFAARYGSGINLAGQYDGSLNDGGEEIVLQLPDPYAAAILRFNYNNTWYPATDGGGYALTVIDTGALPAAWDGSANWQTGAILGGSPGRADAATVVPSIVINEVLAHTDEPYADAIELYNTTDQAIDITGWWLSDDAGNFRKFQIPALPGGAPRILGAHQYVVFYQGHFENHVLVSDPVYEFGGSGPGDFALNSYLGDQVWLAAGDAAGNVTQVVDYVQFGPSANPRIAGVYHPESFGRWSVDPANLWKGTLYPLAAPTLGQANNTADNGPRVGPLLISELMYNVGPVANASDLEFVEIYNPTSTAVDLNRWRLSGGVDFDFSTLAPADRMLGARQTLVVVSFDPNDPANAGRLTAFRSHYGIGTAVKIVGGYSGKLSDLGETVRLLDYDEPPLEDPSLYPSLLEDEVAYSNTWGANGTGQSLHRNGTAYWGHDPASWTAAAATPGTAEAPSPRIVARKLFYNRSGYDGGSPAANAADDGAIAIDKMALLPGGTATLANYSNYARGLNGIMIDLAGAPNAAAITAADFTFKVGNDDTPDEWTAAPAPASVSVRLGAGVGGSDRVTIIWSDNAIENQWLQVTVKNSANTGLAVADVFYFGNAIGESGDSPLNTAVDRYDEQAVLAHFTSSGATTITDPFDFNRDGLVNETDKSVAQANHSGTTPLRLLGRSLVFSAAAGAWTDAGLTLRLTDDGLLHLYRTGTAIDAVAPVAADSVNGIQITGRDNLSDTLTIDFGGGSPLPNSGLSFNGGAGVNTLSIAAATRSDTLTMSATQLFVNGVSAVNLANVQNYRFDLGAGVFDLGGAARAVGDLTLVSGQIVNGTLNAASYTILGGTVSATLGSAPITKQSAETATVTTPVAAATVDVQDGQLKAPSIVADTLTIGSGAKLQLTGTGTSVVNFLSIFSPSGGFNWTATDTAPVAAAASEPASPTVLAASQEHVAQPAAVTEVGPVNAILLTAAPEIPLALPDGCEVDPVETVDLSWVGSEASGGALRPAEAPWTASRSGMAWWMAAYAEEARRAEQQTWRLADVEESIAQFAPARKTLPPWAFGRPERLRATMKSAVER